MNTGKTLFGSSWTLLPWTTFTRIVEDRYGGDLTGSGRFPAPSNTGPWPSPS